MSTFLGKGHYLNLLVVLTFWCMGTQAVHASCLSEVAAFAKDICGEFDKKGIHKITDVQGNIDVGVKGIISKAIKASANASIRNFEETYEGVLLDQLGPERFDLRSCKREMVKIARAEVCKRNEEVEVDAIRTHKLWRSDANRTVPGDGLKYIGCENPYNWAINNCKSTIDVDVSRDGGGGGACGHAEYTVMCAGQSHKLWRSDTNRTVPGDGLKYIGCEDPYKWAIDNCDSTIDVDLSRNGGGGGACGHAEYTVMCTPKKK